MKTPLKLGWITACFASIPLLAQLPGDAAAMHVGELLPGAIGLRVENMNRTLKDGENSASLDAMRVTASLQMDVAPGVSPWVEAGWHAPQFQSGKSSGGFTWGSGVNLRPFLTPLRSDPVLGPRDWIALKVDFAIRGGEAEADAGKIDWLNLEGVFGFEWHKKYLGRNDGPMGAYDITAGSGVILNSLEGNQGALNGSEEQSIGIRLNTGFTFGVATFVKLEVDLFGSSDHRLSMVSGFRF